MDNDLYSFLTASTSYQSKTADVVRELQERDITPHWECCSKYPITGNAVSNGTSVPFVVHMISNDEIYARARVFMSPTTTWEAQLDIPLAGKVDAVIQVRKTSHNLVFDADFVSIPVKFKEQIAKYLWSYGYLGGRIPSLRDFHMAGLIPPMTFVHSHANEGDNFQDVIDLRHDAYKETLLDKRNAEVMAWTDEYDKEAVVITVRHRNKLVATGRLIPATTSNKMINETLCKLPDNLPDRNLIMESNWLCTHPNYRSSSLFLQVIRSLMIASLEHRRFYVIANCTTDLLPRYQLLGGKKLGANFRHKDDGKIHHVIIVDIMQVYYGKQISMQGWSILVMPEWRKFKELVEKSKSKL